MREDLTVVDNERLDDPCLLATVRPVGVPAGVPDEVGGPDYGQVTSSHSCGGEVLGEVVKVTHQVRESLQVMVRKVTDCLSHELAVLVDREARYLHQSVVEVVGQQRVGE